MSEYKLSEIELLKIIYQEIIEGVSYSEKGFYVKHLNELDNISILKKRIEFFNGYIAQGLLSEKDKIAELIKSEAWTQKKEDKILELKYTISDNEKNLPKIIQQQQAAIKKIIQKHKEELVELLYERRKLIDITADEYSERDALNFMAYLSLFRDKACKQRYFESWDVFEQLEDGETDILLKEIESIFSRYKENNIRKIASLPFFINSFSYTKENISNFLKKPIAELTNYQLLLFSVGSRNVSILSQSEGEPPEMLDDVTPQQVLDWYDSQYSILLGKRNTKHR